MIKCSLTEFGRAERESTRLWLMTYAPLCARPDPLSWLRAKYFPLRLSSWSIGTILHFGHLTDIHIYVLSIYYLRDSVIWYGGYLGILILPRLYWFLELFQTMRYCINIIIMPDILNFMCSDIISRNFYVILISGTWKNHPEP